MVRTFQLTKVLSRLTVVENMRTGATGQKGETLLRAMFPFLWRSQEDDITEQGRLPARALPARCQAGGLRRLALRRAAQAARDGSRPDGRARDGDAGRADGRREPRAEAVAPPAREVAAGRGTHGALRGARHGHGARHLRLGDRDGAGQDHRGGTARLRDERPAGHRRLPRLAPRPGPERHGGDRARRGAGRDHRQPRRTAGNADAGHGCPRHGRLRRGDADKADPDKGGRP